MIGVETFDVESGESIASSTISISTDGSTADSAARKRCAWSVSLFPGGPSILTLQAGGFELDVMYGLVES